MAAGRGGEPALPLTAPATGYMFSNSGHPGKIMKTFPNSSNAVTLALRSCSEARPTDLLEPNRPKVLSGKFEDNCLSRIFPELCRATRKIWLNFVDGKTAVYSNNQLRQKTSFSGKETVCCSQPSRNSLLLLIKSDNSWKFNPNSVCLG